MRNLGIKSLIILVMVFASAVTAYATQPTEASGTWFISEVAWGSEGEFMPTIVLEGDLEGSFVHSFEQARADHVEFEGCVQGVHGKFEAVALEFGPAGKTTMTVKQGSQGLESLRAHGTAVITGFDDFGLPLGTYELDVHFDPTYPGISPECE